MHSLHSRATLSYDTRFARDTSAVGVGAVLTAIEALKKRLFLFVLSREVQRFEIFAPNSVPRDRRERFG